MDALFRSFPIRHTALLVAGVLSPFVTYVLKTRVYDPLERRLPAFLWALVHLLVVRLPRLLFLPIGLVVGFAWSGLVYTGLGIVVARALSEGIVALLTAYDEHYGLENSFLARWLMHLARAYLDSVVARVLASITAYGAALVDTASAAVLTLSTATAGTVARFLNETLAL